MNQKLSFRAHLAGLHLGLVLFYVLQFGWPKPTAVTTAATHPAETLYIQSILGGRYATTVSACLYVVGGIGGTRQQWRPPPAQAPSDWPPRGLALGIRDAPSPPAAHPNRSRGV